MHDIRNWRSSNVSMVNHVRSPRFDRRYSSTAVSHAFFNIREHSSMVLSLRICDNTGGRSGGGGGGTMFIFYYMDYIHHAHVGGWCVDYIRYIQNLSGPLGVLIIFDLLKWE